MLLESHNLQLVCVWLCLALTHSRCLSLRLSSKVAKFRLCFRFTVPWNVIKPSDSWIGTFDFNTWKQRTVRSWYLRRNSEKDQLEVYCVILNHWNCMKSPSKRHCVNFKGLSVVKIEKNTSVQSVLGRHSALTITTTAEVQSCCLCCHFPFWITSGLLFSVTPKTSVRQWRFKSVRFCCGRKAVSVDRYKL